MKCPVMLALPEARLECGVFGPQEEDNGMIEHNAACTGLILHSDSIKH
jgi:hypothetical protein